MKDNAEQKQRLKMENFSRIGGVFTTNAQDIPTTHTNEQ